MGSRSGSAVVILALASVASCHAGAPRPPALPPVGAHELRDPSAFAGIADPKERSRAMFLEATRVMFHPRCINCHPAGDSPTQGEQRQLHDPPVVRGPDNDGVVGMKCGSCHQDRNLELARVPGAPKWQLAPREMAWAGRSPAAVCEQLKDPERNGSRSLADIVHHASGDELVAWGWSGAHGREAPPGSQAAFGALMAAWVSSGAVCPKLEGFRLVRAPGDRRVVQSSPTLRGAL